MQVETQATTLATPNYDEEIVKKFAIASLVFGVIGMFVGVWIAAQLAYPALNFGIPELSFGRLRPLHTNAVIFAFGGNMLFAAGYYIVQRTCQTRLWNDFLSNFTFWGWQAVLIGAVITLPMGLTSTHEYAELIWPLDILIALVWVAYGVNFFGTLATRKVSHIYVANWFTAALIITVALLHIFRSLQLPYSWTQAIPFYSGVQDAMVQWWYGHNAVGFFLTAGFLALMYYFLPKQANRPVYSYRLSIVHFWGLIFIYVWAGPHHLLYTSLPEWTQTLGMAFSIVLWVPSWGGMFNGLMTLKGAWHKLRTDPIIKFMIVAVTFYGMSTFEGPMMSIRSVHTLSHYTDWVIGHVHSGAIGWVAMISIGSLYYLFPRLFKKDAIYSTKLINVHFWMHTLGLVLYVAAMWVSGITQGLMWRAVNADGSLTYSFAESVAAMMPYYNIRMMGGILVVGGMLIMAYNVYKTAKLPDAKPSLEPKLAVQ